jgi:hypothetical protein
MHVNDETAQRSPRVDFPSAPHGSSLHQAELVQAIASASDGSVWQGLTSRWESNLLHFPFVALASGMKIHFALPAAHALQAFGPDDDVAGFLARSPSMAVYRPVQSGMCLGVLPATAVVVTGRIGVPVAIALLFGCLVRDGEGEEEEQERREMLSLRLRSSGSVRAYRLTASGLTAF